MFGLRRTLVVIGLAALCCTLPLHPDLPTPPGLHQVSVAFGSASLVAALLTLGAMCRSLLWVVHRGLRWEGPRVRVLALIAVPLVLQTANLGLWMANMIITLTGSCSWFDRSGEGGCGCAAIAASLMPR